jgi:hypothetical protein
MRRVNFGCHSSQTGGRWSGYSRRNICLPPNVIKEKRGDLGTFTLSPGLRFKGKVFDAKGKPVVGVIVNAQSLDLNDEITRPIVDNINRSTITDGKGEFEMRPLPPGNYTVVPSNYPLDGSLDRKEKIKSTELPCLFTGSNVRLKTGTEPEFVELRAIPHVTIEARYLDSKGKPTLWKNLRVDGQIDGMRWETHTKLIDGNRKVVALVPHGLENTQLAFTMNQDVACRWRMGKDKPLNNSMVARLGTMNDDVKSMEIITYISPRLIVKVATKDGTPPVNPDVTAACTKGKSQYPERIPDAGGRETDVPFGKQQDGRFSAAQLLPDEDLVISGHADGYADKSVKVNLAEGETKEIEIVLEKAPAAQDK